MEKDNQLHDKDFEALYKKIFGTITRSPEIRNELMKLLEEGKLKSQTVFVLMVKLEEMLKAIMQSEMEALEKKEARISGDTDKVKKNQTRRLLPKRRAQYIDGKELSQAEIEFEEYCRKEFDEDSWLKELGIEYPKEGE